MSVAENVGQKLKLFDHQEKSLRFHLDHDCSFDLSDVGVGKSAPLALWMQHLSENGIVGKFLLVCPTSIISNWQNELKMWTDLTSVALIGDKKKRLGLLQQKNLADVWIINFEGVRVVFSELYAMNFGAIVVDEAHHIKSHAGSHKTPTQAFLVRELGKLVKYRKAATGTVLTNDVEDIWAIAQFVQPSIFRMNHWGFKNTYMFNENAGKPWMSWPNWKPKPGAVDEIHKRLEPYAIRFEKREVLRFLPPVLFQRRNIELSDEQRKAYKELKKHFVTELDGCDEPLAALQILSRITKLLQICSGFVYLPADDSKGAYHFKQNAKLAELKNVLEEIGKQKVIIWCAFKEEIEIVKTVLGTQDFGVLTGDTKQADRQEIVNLFNSGSLQYLLCHPACAGEGLNIMAPYAIYFSRGWKLGERLQSLGRNDRPGIEKVCDNITIIDLVATNSVDEEVMAALERKSDLLATINPRSFREMMS